MPNRRMGCQLHADIVAAKHDQMIGQATELQRLDMRERLSLGEPRYVWNRGARTPVGKDAFSSKQPGSPSGNRTSIFFGATNRPSQMISSAPLVS